MLRLLRSTYRPNLVVAGRPAGAVSVAAASSVPLLATRPAIDGATAAYLCRHFACERPVTSMDDLAALLQAQA